MKKILKRIFAMVIAVTVVWSIIPVNTTYAAKTSINKCKIVLSKTNFSYTGSACKPTVTVKKGSKALKKGKDYTVKYSNNKNPGKATVLIKGKGSYSGSVKKTFKIKNGLTVSLSKKSYVYSGKANKPSVTVKSGSVKLAAKYYKVTYKNNIKVGTASVIVNGKGKYKGKNALVTFKITKATQSNDNSSSDNSTLKLNYSNIVIVSDQTATLKATNANGSVTWTSSNSSVVSVDSQGNIRGCSTGNANITVKDSKSSVTCAVNVVNYDFIPLSLELNEGETKSFQVIESGPSQEYYFESEDTSMVTVDGSEKTVKAVGSSSGNVNVNLCVDTTFGVKKFALNVTVKAESLFTASFTNSNYKVASGAADKLISSGESADLNLLEGNNDTCSSDAYYQTGEIATVYKDGYNYYFVADTWNNRVIVYRTSESDTWGKTKHGVSDDIYCILGQSNMSSRKSGCALNQMNWPVGVAATVVENQIRVYVADTYNDRILVWNDLPSENGVAADYSIMDICDPEEVQFDDDVLINSSENTISWPWSIWTDGEKLICAATRSGKVLIWDTLPSITDKYPDRMIKLNGTPRTISYRNGYLVVGDHNAVIDGVNTPGVHLYNNIDELIYTSVVSKNDSSKTLLKYVKSDGDVLYKEDGTYPSSLILDREVTTASGDSLPAGTLLLLMSSRISVWKDGKVDSATDKPDYYIGGGVLNDNRIFMFLGSNNPGMILDHNGNFYTALASLGTVVGYENGKLPGEPADISDAILKEQEDDVFIYNGEYYHRHPENGLMKFATEKPDLCIGAESSTTSDGLETNINTQTLHNGTCNIETYSNYLVGCGKASNYLYIWKSIPDSDDALPDTVLTFDTGIVLNDVQLFNYQGKTALIAGGGSHVFIWYDIEDAIAGKKYDLVYNGSIGSVELTDVEALSFIDGYFMLSNGDHQFLIFDGFPTLDSTPVKTLDIAVQTLHATKCDDGNVYLGVGAGGYSSDYGRIYLLSDLLKGETEPKYLLKGAVRTWVNSANGLTESKCAFNGAKEVLVTEDGSVAVTDQGFARCIIWKTIEDAVNEGENGVVSENRIVLGSGSGSTSEYTNKDVRDADSTNKGTDSINDPIPNDAADMLFMPSGITYDGTYLWISDFKFSNGIKRYTGKLFNK